MWSNSIGLPHAPALRLLEPADDLKCWRLLSSAHLGSVSPCINKDSELNSTSHTLWIHYFRACQFDQFVFTYSFLCACLLSFVLAYGMFTLCVSSFILWIYKLVLSFYWLLNSVTNITVYHETLLMCRTVWGALPVYSSSQCILLTCRFRCFWQVLECISQTHLTSQNACFTTLIWLYCNHHTKKLMCSRIRLYCRSAVFIVFVTCFLFLHFR